MKPTTCLLLIIIPLLQLAIPGSAQCTLDSSVDTKIKAVLSELEYKHSAPMKKLSCFSVKNTGRLSSCPAGTTVTGCSCGYACGSWDVRGENTCHCQCAVMDWTTARCCHLS
ncbi:resistin-like beta [Dasypus novemcinctus]|uniref:resistin-like beta n=1 Tax=Dasypus novemcinctus TaxID=9361 RepID=UPI00265FBB85|nr:resistin-like beta isoform X2 [Dasypus novemcinctus]